MVIGERNLARMITQISLCRSLWVNSVFFFFVDSASGRGVGADGVYRLALRLNPHTGIKVVAVDS